MMIFQSYNERNDREREGEQRLEWLNRKIALIYVDCVFQDNTTAGIKRSFSMFLFTSSI